MEPAASSAEKGNEESPDRAAESWGLLWKLDLSKFSGGNRKSNDKGKAPDIRLHASAARTQAVLNVVCGIEGIDTQLMPASFKVLQSDFHWALQDLGSLVFYQSVSQAVAGLGWGVLADRTSRVRLLSLGCAGWGMVSIFLGSATCFWQFALLKVLNGIALASISPVAQSLIADFFPPTMRGEHFGWLQLFLCSGCILGAMIGGSVASITVTEGVKVLAKAKPQKAPSRAFYSSIFCPADGYFQPQACSCPVPDGIPRDWGTKGPLVVALPFFSAGVLSLLAAALVKIVAKEPPRNQIALVTELPVGLVDGSKPQNSFSGLYLRCHNFCRAAVSRTFLLLLLQGVCGYIPLHAFQFYTLYFQLVGMPDWQASLLTACPLVGSLLGSLFGGWLGDQAEEWNEFHGRPLVGQLGTLLALPLIYIGLLGIPRRPEFFGVYAIDMLFLGFAISWCPSGVNRPILSEIVEPDARATVFATQIAFEGSISAMLGSPVIALLAESLFGYRTGVPFHAAVERERNTEALANALLVATAFPWTVCFFLYGLLHFTYPNDLIAYETFRAASSRRKAEKGNTTTAYAPLLTQPSPDPKSMGEQCSKTCNTA